MGAETDQAEEEEVPPRVVVASMSDLGRLVPEPLRKGFGSRPIWFLRQDDEELVTIFEQLPEDPMPKGRAHELLKALRTFADEHSDRLQELLGRTEAIIYAFHGDADVGEVAAAFEEDGFFVWTDVVKQGAFVELPAAD